MRYHFKENLGERRGVVSNLHSFLNRNLDTGFSTKWSGLWSPPYKFLDYFSFRLNGTWLGPETVEAVDYGEEMVFYHQTDSFRVREKVQAPSTSTGVELSLEVENKMDRIKAVHLAVELGVDIRDKSTDIDEKDYEISKGPERITFRRNGKKLMFSSDRNFKLTGERFIKEHFPEERQKCLVPGKISFREELEDKKVFRMELSTSEIAFGGLKETGQEMVSGEIGRLFDCSVDSLRNLVYEKNGIGIIAGHPWFQSYWARDSFWSVLGLIDAGFFELSEDILTNFAEKDVRGKIPLGEDAGEDEEQFPRADTDPLFVIAADKLERHFRTNERIEEAVESCMMNLAMDDGVVKHDPRGTWMDTLERGGAIEIQSLWLEAARARGDDRAEELERGLEKFYSGDFMEDCLEGDARSINPAVPLMFGQLESEKALRFLETLNSEFSSRFGARTRSMLDEGYDSEGYHTGSSWGLTTGWAAAANFENGNFRAGRNFLEKMTQFLDRNQPGALPETVDSENGELIGCSEQAWSAGLMVHVIDSYMLGIRVGRDTVRVDPAGGFTGERKGKKVRGERIDLRFEDGKAEILNDPDIQVEVR